MNQIKNLFHKLLLSQGHYYSNEQAYVDNLKTKLIVKERQYAGAGKLAEQALDGFDNENAGKAFGGTQAHAQKYLKKYYKDLFENVDFERDEYKKLN